MNRPVKPPPAALMATPEDTEAQFYEALQQGDLDRMMAVWADEDEIACVHPGGPRVIGAAAIRASFEAIFANGGVPVTPEQVHRVESMGCAVHHLSERITMTTAEGVRTAWVIATNVFVKTERGWRMLVHHASPGGVDAQPQSMGAAPTVLH